MSSLSLFFRNSAINLLKVNYCFSNLQRKTRFASETNVYRVFRADNLENSYYTADPPVGGSLIPSSSYSSYGSSSSAKFSMTNIKSNSSGSPTFALS